MANTLLLNQPQVFNGPGTLTYTVPTGTPTQLYTVKVSATFPMSPPINSKVPTATGIGFGGLGFMGAGSGMSLGAGTGGGAQGFVNGDQGTGEGGKGLGFSTGNNYQQPPSESGNATAQSPTTSSLSIVVSKNAVAQYTSTAPVPFQSALQFQTPVISLAAGDVVTVVASSSADVDNQRDGVTITASIQQGF